jgi:hypothetical protein
MPQGAVRAVFTSLRLALSEAGDEVLAAKAVRKLSTLRRFLNGMFIKDVGGLQIILSALHLGGPRPGDKALGGPSGVAVSGPLPSLSFDPSKLESVTVGAQLPLSPHLPPLPHAHTHMHSDTHPCIPPPRG